MDKRDIVIASFATGSSGNSYIYSVDRKHLFIDMGIGSRRIAKKMEDLGLNWSGVSGAVIGHLHSDHWKGVSLANKHGFPVYATAPTFDCMENSYIGTKLNDPNLITDVDDVFYSIGPFRVYPFATMHDVPGSLGFFIEHDDAPNLFVLTDTGKVTENALQYMRAGDFVIMESNYDDNLLSLNQEYSEDLKSRIRSEYGHLSNHDAAVAIGEHSKIGAQVFLAHLSEHNNTPDIAELTMSAVADVDAIALFRHDTTIMLDERRREESGHDESNSTTKFGEPTQ